jgi:hypothetical protein
LSALARAAAVAGDRDRATALLDHAEHVAAAIADRDAQTSALTGVAEAAIATADHDRAAALIDRIAHRAESRCPRDTRLEEVDGGQF